MLQSEFYTSDMSNFPPELLSKLNPNVSQGSSTGSLIGKVAELPQRTTGIPVPSSIDTTEPIFISGTGATSSRLVGATQTVYGNNGTVSCTTYCGGTDHGPWNGELPKDWFGAKCVKTSNPKYTCDMTAGESIQCTCAPSGNGWNA